MNILIIEDNAVLQKDLQQKLVNIDSSIHITGMLSSVQESVNWLQSHPAPDLIFMDIQLMDGMCFEIFGQVPVKSPIVFVTSFNEYAVKAFELSSIDYIVKPAEEGRLRQSLNKYRGLKDTFSGSSVMADLQKIILGMNSPDQSQVKRLLVYKGEHIIPVDPVDVAYFYFEEKSTFLVTHDNKKYSIGHTLEALESMLNPEQFFRANRQFILSLTCIKDIISLFNNKLKIEVSPSTPSAVIISKEKAHSFKEWLNG